MKCLEVVDTETTDGGGQRKLRPIARVRSPRTPSHDSAVEIEAITPRTPKRKGRFSRESSSNRKRGSTREHEKQQRPHHTSRSSKGTPQNWEALQSPRVASRVEINKAGTPRREEASKQQRVPSMPKLSSGRKIPFRRETPNFSNSGKKELQSSKRNDAASKPRTPVGSRIAPTPRHQEEGQELLLGFSNLAEEEVRDFDLMNINITIYGMKGILCEEKEATKTKKRRSFKSSKQKDISCHMEEDFNIPQTTAAASVARNVSSSQTVIETFLPSQPMNIYSEPGKSTRLGALWQNPSTKLLQAEGQCQDDKAAPKLKSSFEILRMMMKRPFVKGQNAGFVENYVHETIEIGLNLCRGKELLRFGVANLVITGEEEGEVMIHIPIMSAIVQNMETSKKKKKDMKTRNKIRFEKDDRYFALDENASLYVGVQVHPQQDVEAAAEYQEEIQASDSELLRRAHETKKAMMKHQTKAVEQQGKIFYQSFTASTASTSSSGRKHFTSSKRQQQPPQSTRQQNSQSQWQNQQQKQKQNHQYQMDQTRTSKKAATMTPSDTESILSSFLCGAALPLMPESGNDSKYETQKSVSLKKNLSMSEPQSEEIANGKSLPMTEILNLKYGPEYAKSFFSAVTFSTGASSSEDFDLAEVVEATAKQLSLM